MLREWNDLPEPARWRVSAAIFFDSNALLYTLDENDPRWVIAGGLLAQGGAISVHVLNEFARVAHRKAKLS